MLLNQLGSSVLWAFSFHLDAERHVLKSKRALLELHPRNRTGEEPQALPWLISGDLAPVNALSCLCLQCLVRVRDLRRGSSFPCSLPCGHVWRQSPGKEFSSPTWYSGWAAELFEGIWCQEMSPSNKNRKGGQGVILPPKMMGGGDGVVPIIHSQAN